jgi:O-antigen chain-terminating methyltransferase
VKPNVEEIMADIRTKVRQGSVGSEQSGRQSSRAEPGKSTVTPLLYSEELNYLNANWHNWRSPTEVTSHRPIIGPLIVRAKKFLAQVIWNTLLKDYFEREKNFQAQLVRYLNATARYVDARDSEIFWHLIRKIDTDTAGGEERIAKLFDECDSALRAVEGEVLRRIAQVENRVPAEEARYVSLQAQLKQVDEVARGLERTVALLARRPVSSVTEVGDEVARIQFTEGVDYLLLENRYRGSEEEIATRTADYLPLFRSLPGRVVDIGCGRGEFLEILRSAGVEAIGIDLDEAMVARCAAKGLPVQHGDGLQLLRESGERTVGGVMASQVVEHLPRQVLEQFLELLAKKLAIGGRVALETINPQSVTALCRNFFRDPTHIWPLHPETLAFMMEMKGLKVEQIIYRSPYPAEAMLKPIPMADGLPARWNDVLQRFNDNIDRLNQLLFGHQDYCIVGTVE